MRWLPLATKVKEEEVAKRLRASSKFYRFLWEIRNELFDEDFEDLLTDCYHPRGQEPCPPALLAMVMLLQRYEGLSDARAVDAAENDRRWQLVLGTLGEEKAPFGQGSLVRFRVRMIANDLDKNLVERTVQLAKATQGFSWKRLRASLDSSPLEGCGRVEDAWNLIGRAMSKVVHVVSIALNIEEEEVIKQADLSVLMAGSVKAALDINWDDEKAQSVALEQVLNQVSRLERWVTRQVVKDKVPINKALELMRKVIVQETEPPDPDGGGSKIKAGVPSERIISVSDPEMRHGRKSKTKRFNGYKRHIAISNRLILSTAVEPANLLENTPTERLIDDIEKYGSIGTLDIDRGYLSSHAVESLHRSGVEINCRPWKSNKYKGLYTKDDFHINLKRNEITCPEGNTAIIFPSRAAWFSYEDCKQCSQKASCTTAARRTVSIHRQEDLQIKLRNQSKTKKGRQELRKRVVVEHRLARIGAIQGRKARYRGARKNELDLNRSAAIANLQEVARLRAA